MQKFTRSLTREIEVGGERLALTLSEEGLSVRPVGSRRPPHSMTWSAWLVACVAGKDAEQPTADQVAEAVKALRTAPTGKKGKKAEDTEEESDGEAPPEEEAEEQSAAPAPAAAPPAGQESSNLADLLARVDKWLATHRPRFHKALKPGATASECDTLAAALGGKLPGELRTWLMWHNGQDAEVMGAFEENWNLLSVQEITEAKKDLDAQPHEGWQKTWVPFLDDDNGDYLCLDTGSEKPPVRECWRGKSDHPEAAPSLTKWVADFLAALEKGSYTEDPERGSFHRR
jgi:cell wall assembly regulator SMI1